MTDSRCDFCASAAPPPWVLPVRDFVSPELGSGSEAMEGDWMACDACAGLIRAGMWEALTARLEATMRAETGQPMRDEERAAMQALHLRVRDNATGPIQPI